MPDLPGPQGQALSAVKDPPILEVVRNRPLPVVSEHGLKYACPGDDVSGLGCKPPPQKEGPVAGVTLDVDNLAREYRLAMGWDPQSGRPDEATLEKLGLTMLINAHG